MKTPGCHERCDVEDGNLGAIDALSFLNAPHIQEGPDQPRKRVFRKQTG